MGCEVGVVKRKRDKRGRKRSSLNLVNEFKKGVEVKNQFGLLEESGLVDGGPPELEDSDSDGEEIKVKEEEPKKRVKGEKVKSGLNKIKPETKVVEEKFIGPVEARGGKKMRIRFQVAVMKKLLMSVKRLVESGNRVVFSEGGSYIVNDKTGDRLKLTENVKGSYIMDVDFVGGWKGEITVDSGAEESVCPWEWGSRFKVNEGVPKLNFRVANGSAIKHHGERFGLVTSEGF